jgi:hypothetical protein
MVTDTSTVMRTIHHVRRRANGSYPLSPCPDASTGPTRREPNPLRARRVQPHEAGRGVHWHPEGDRPRSADPELPGSASGPLPSLATGSRQESSPGDSRIHRRFRQGHSSTIGCDHVDRPRHIAATS